MATVDEFFGASAGMVWSTLHDFGPQNIATLKRKTKLTDPKLYGALGWLAREGKLSVIGETPLLYKYALVQQENV
jgi:hypothetical protein